MKVPYSDREEGEMLHEGAFLSIWDQKIITKIAAYT